MMKHKLLFIVVITAFAACTTETPLPLNSLVNIVEELSGNNCEFGGVKIETGIVNNSNNILDADEVTSTHYVCNGASSNALVNTVEEPIGINCANGGQKIEVGVDVNENSILEAEETQSTSYVCNGDTNGGATYLILTGDISNEEAAAKIASDVGTNTRFVWITNTTQLTTVN